MNTVQLLGRIARDIDLRYSTSGTAVARFSVAVDRPTKEGAEKQTDFPTVVAFGRTAETIEKFFRKGSRIGISGRLQTGSYKDKDGRTIYTTDVVVTGFDFCESRGGDQRGERQGEAQARRERRPETPAFEELDEDVPF
jgi:single-strand DNA-binding protein